MSAPADQRASAPVPWAERLHTSVRAKLLAMVLLPLAVVLPVLVSILLVWGSDGYDRLLIYKIHSDLAVANEHLRQVQASVGAGVAQLADSHRLARAVARHDARALDDFLRSSQETLGLDFLHVVDAQGRVIATSSRLAAGTPLTHRPAVRAALGSASTTVLDVFSADDLGAIDPALRERARIAFVPTRNAQPTNRVDESRGLVIHTAAPVRDDQGHTQGALVGGQLLNRNLEFVDRLNEIIYPEGALPFGSHGTATLFLGDVRIATNVRLFEGERAIGTRVSADVRRAVLDDGQTWLDRAFVVSDWYVSAYQPLRDSQGARVGMLYVGYLETPFRAAKQWALGGLIALFAVTVLAATVLALRWARGIFRPLERMNDTMSAIERGNDAARVGPVGRRDEIGHLAQHFDQMLDQLAQQQRDLRHWADALDAKVVERTQALQEAQRQLVLSEKLAAVGELTAGVAHEINNPVAVIQGNLDVMREVLGPATASVETELRLIDDQIDRIRLIVAKLLQFARPTEYAGYVEPVQPAAVFADSLVLVGHLLRRSQIAVTQAIETTACLHINRNELLQVLINLLANSIQAMPDGGLLTLAAFDQAGPDGVPGVVMRVSDTGSGIAPEHLGRVFDPFFSTKGTAGTGLGLSVSYGLVQRYGGTITVESAPGAGARFDIWLPCEPLL